MNAGRPSNGSPPPTLSTNDATNAAIDPVRLAFGSKSANSSCGNNRTKTRSLVKNHSAWTLWTLSARTVASAPNRKIDDRMTRFIWTTDREGQTRRFRQFQLSIDPAERIDELKLDVTAPVMAARPSMPATGGTACAKSNGIASAGCACSRASVAGPHG